MGATYYTPKTLAAHWGCSPDIVYDLLRSGKLHGFRLGRSWRVTEEAREAYETSTGPAERDTPVRPVDKRTVNRIY